MQEILDGFVFSLVGTQKKSGNTILSYKRDIAHYIAFLNEKGISDIKKTNRTTVLTYLLLLQKQGRAAATISRRLASLRSFYGYIQDSGVKMKDPTLNLEAPKVSRKVPGVLTTQETEILLSMPKLTSPKGYRDRAMLEVLYATGIKVSELINLNIQDVNLKQGYITCRSASHTRNLQMGRAAIYALRDYIEKARNTMIPSEDVKILFLNCNGTKLSRQGFWKILKGYGKEAGIKKEITPYTLRHSFAIHLMENGADLKFVSQMLGYTDTAAMQVYADILDSGMREEYQKSHPRA